MSQTMILPSTNPGISSKAYSDKKSGISSEESNSIKNKKSSLSVVWKEVKDRTKLFLRNNYLLKKNYSRYKKKKTLFKEFL